MYVLVSDLDSNLFITVQSICFFSPPQNGDYSAPLLLWLTGGPGSSSLMALFMENGPLVVNSNGEGN